MLKSKHRPQDLTLIFFGADDAEAQACTLVPGGAHLVKNATRWQFLGAWRLTKPVQRGPLIFTDSRSIPDSDLRDLSRDKLGTGDTLGYVRVKACD